MVLSRYSRHTLLIGLFVSVAVLYTNCGKGLQVTELSESEILDQRWLAFSADEALIMDSASTPVSAWIYPTYSLLPLTEAGKEPFSLYAQRMQDLSPKFSAPTPLISTNARNVYNPNVVRVTGDASYPFRMYFFGWAKEACNTHLPYHPEHNARVKKNERWCDSIFVARGRTSVGPWQILEEDFVFRDNLQSSEKWKPILYSNDRAKVWDYHHTGDPSVIQVNGLYFMAYSVSGHDVDEIYENDVRDTDGGFYAIGGAYSYDGLRWTKLGQPLLTSRSEFGCDKTGINGSERNSCFFHRPSLIYDGGKFRMWFDYSKSPVISMGYAELMGEPTIGSFTSGAWVIKQGLTNPAINNWVNPAVVKTPNGYFSYSDAIIGEAGATDWHLRKVQEAYSADGINWTFNGFLPHLPDCLHSCPEAIYVDGTIQLMYHCQSNAGAGPTMYVRKRRNLDVTVPGPKICTPGATRSCVVANGTGTETCNGQGSAYGFCRVNQCQVGFELVNESCVRRQCRAESATQQYISESIAYFATAKTIPSVASIAAACENQIKAGIELLVQSNWECSRASVVAENVKACVQRIESIVKTPCANGDQAVNGKCVACVAPAATQQYLTTAVAYLQGAVTIPQVAAAARACLTNLQQNLPALQAQKWPCENAQRTSDYISTCINQVIIPNLPK